MATASEASMSVKVQVLDERGLPVSCSVAAVRTSTQEILALYETDAEGVAHIAQAGTWYPRPMVSLNYKSRIKLIILNDQNAPCYDYVVSSDGGGTHLTVREMMATFLADAAAETGTDRIKRSAWLCSSDTDINIEWGSADSNVGLSYLLIEGAMNDGEFVNDTTEVKLRWLSTAAAADSYFKTTLLYTPSITFRNIHIEGGGANQTSLLHRSNASTISSATITFDGCRFALNTVSDNTAVVRCVTGGWSGALSFVNCKGSASSLVNATQAGPTAIQKLVVKNCEMTLNRLAVGNSIQLTQITGSELTFNTAGFNPSGYNNCHGFHLSSSIIHYLGSGIWFSLASSLNQDSLLYFVDIDYDQTNAAATFASISGTNTKKVFFADGVVLRALAAAAGPALTLAGSGVMYVGDVLGYNWTTVVSGGTTYDHGTLTGLADDDHTIYLLAAGTRALTADWAAGTARTITIGTLSTDVISERTAAAGVTIDGTLIKDGEVNLVNERILVTAATAAASHFDVFQSGDTQPRFRLRSESGANAAALYWGAGGASSLDVALFRGAADVLQVGSGDSLWVPQYLRVGAASAPTNTTAGDLNAIRGYIGADAAILTGLSLQVAGALGLSANNMLRLYDTDNSHYIGHRADSARTTDIVYVWPVADPTVGQILSASAPAAGVVTLSWAADATGGGGGGAVATDAIWDLLGDTVYGTGADTAVRLAGNITTTRQFLRQVGNGAVSAAPAWDTLASGDMPASVVETTDAAWIDLTDGLASTAHSHAGAGGFDYGKAIALNSGLATIL